MKGFALDNNGDVIIEKNKIKMIDGVDRMVSKCR